MSQENLASQLNVSRQAISKWELDSSLPDTENIIQLGELFEVSIDYLLKDNMENIKEKNVLIVDKRPKNIFMFGVACIVISTLSFFTVWILSKIYPAPLVFYDTTKKLWKTGVANFIWIHGLEWLIFVIVAIFIMGVLLTLHTQLKYLLASLKMKQRRIK